MRKPVEYYCGRQITKEVINRVVAIEKIYEEESLDSGMSLIDSLEELCYYHETEPEQENIILGEDWYISYIVDNSIIISDWFAIKNSKNILTRTAEMLSAMKKVLLLSAKDGNSIMCYMRHNTSYPFYCMFEENGYFETIDDTIYLDDDRPKEMDIVIDKIKNKNKVHPNMDADLEKYVSDNITFFEKADIEPYPEYGQYFFHDVEFILTKKFINRYK